MTSQYSFLNSLTYEQRIAELGLNPDRADVIIPATRIYLNAMKWSGARQIYVPKIGLSDGIRRLCITVIYKSEHFFKPKK
jgi:exopolyphosphatase/guanosine-5'-triphosphate,3'-diphosphate pyrophosphatase